MLRCVNINEKVFFNIYAILAITLSHSKQPKLCGVLAVLSVIGLSKEQLLNVYLIHFSGLVTREIIS